MGKYYYCRTDGYHEQETEQNPEQTSGNKWLNFLKKFKPTNLVEYTFLILLIFSVASALYLTVLDSGGIHWLLELKSVKNDPLGELTVVLAPLLALALGIERLVETVFDYFEGTIENIVEKSNLTQAGLRDLEKKLSEAWNEVKQVKMGLPDATLETSAPVADPLTIAEQQLNKVSQFFFDLPKDPKYLAYKSRMAIMISFSLGFIVAIWTDQGIFQYLQISVPRIFDILITGAVLGAGAEPMHSLIGALDGLKGTLKSLSFPVTAK